MKSLKSMAEKKKEYTPKAQEYSPEREKALLELVDGAYDIIELYDPKDSAYNKVWRETWLKKARELGAVPSW
jgi:hypothetical protein